ncbi:wax ester/triacylglycerol synthase domain-containing protein [Nakamurella sp. UYEF19]|uniref:wax ester/triacylglycerol synthase domain-containing protein n=1 Tax=Nakamurella sp. UYEF19 TaxID=1756392 RepID=UPI0033909DC5
MLSLDPADETALLKVAAAAATHPLARDHPLWSITLVNGLEGRHSALFLVIHHVLADGIGGLAALAMLIDSAPVGAEIRSPTSAPPTPQAP